MSDFTTPMHERGHDEDNFRTVIKRDEGEISWLDRAKEHKIWIVAVLLLVLLYAFWPSTPEAPVVAQPSTFVASSGDSLVKEFGYDDAINIAEFVGIPLSKRELGGKLVPITYARARDLRSQTDRNLVRAPLYPGDRINTMRYPGSRQVDLVNSFVLFTPAPNSPELAKR